VTLGRQRHRDCGNRWLGIITNPALYAPVLTIGAAVCLRRPIMSDALKGPTLQLAGEGVLVPCTVDAPPQTQRHCRQMARQRS
jgi:hypothetical protein